MKNIYSILILLLQLLCFSLNTNLSLGGNTISVNGSASSGKAIISSGGNFELGFFTPGDSPYYYIGIWYKKLNMQTVVWVANRDKPLDDHAVDANLIISQGNLVLLDRHKNSIWSALAGNINQNVSVTAVLHDDGNLILSDTAKALTPLLLWQSFDYPTHTCLPGAKLGYDKRTQRKQVYAKCGAFGVCDHKAIATCNCLSGFKPRSDREWNSNDYSGGCVRDQKVQFNAITKDTDSSWITSIIRVPASQNTNITVGKASQCRSACFATCFCTAYTYDDSGTCSIWAGDLFNLQRFSKNEIERTIFVKRGSPEDQTKAKKLMKLKTILSSIIALMILLIGSFSYIYYRRRMAKKSRYLMNESYSGRYFLLYHFELNFKGHSQSDKSKGTQGEHISLWHKAEGEAKVLMNENSDEAIDVPYFHLETILAATDNFSNANKLGQGGFGPVYKVRTSFLHLCGLA
ncbi:receptor-like serine/threonine-protein kinase SD1-8 [Solanum stenotomum]|uniref:receptor-like serine/threonine-protein kinase SD1-8 n=1 Tax=Solanum stenotomum TaxID=172797 RepID=UPI0020D1E440|nr:receptor-like serine/threonine-protein kinase SD1-8 [Solanum stenotomum]